MVDNRIKEFDCQSCGENDPNNFYKSFDKRRNKHYFEKRRCKNCCSKRIVKKKPTYEAKKNSHLKANYGITIDDFESMFLAQEGLCYICKAPSDRTLHVDHCHVTGKVRGLLCPFCNALLGYAKDDISVLDSAINYLKERG